MRGMPHLHALSSTVWRMTTASLVAPSSSCIKPYEALAGRRRPQNGLRCTHLHISHANVWRDCLGLRTGSSETPGTLKLRAQPLRGPKDSLPQKPRSGSRHTTYENRRSTSLDASHYVVRHDASGHKPRAPLSLTMDPSTSYDCDATNDDGKGRG